MNINELLIDLIQRESEDTERKLVLYMCYKFSGQILPAHSKDEYLPLLYIKENSIVLFYQDKTIDTFTYSFSEYEEILIILQNIFKDNENLYLYYQQTEEKKTYSEIMDKIEQSLENEDIESFNHYSALLKED